MVPGTGMDGYSYDPVGNRLSIQREGTTTGYGYDRADRKGDQREPHIRPARAF